MKSLVRFAFVALALLLTAPAAMADSWMPPKVETYSSPNKRVRLTVTPRDLSSALAYFEDKVAKREPAGQRPNSSRTAPAGRLERRGRDGRWQTVWTAALANDVAPVEALVADSGAYVVTLDDWHQFGTGDHSVAIYGPEGKLIRAFELSDLLPPAYIRALPRSVSSIHWRGAARLSPAGDRLILPIVIPEASAGSDTKRFVELEISLETGSILPARPEWEAALGEAKQVAAAKDAEAARFAAAWVAPLSAPQTTREEDWHSYLREAFFRLDHDWKDNYPAVQVLRAPEASDYRPSEKWLRDALLQKESPADVMIIASPASPENLLRVLGEISRSIPRGALGKARIYVVAPPEYRDRLAALLAPSGAEFIHVDPLAPIPQRPERLNLRPVAR